MTELNLRVTSPEIAAAIVSVLQEVNRAEKKHPVWTKDNVKRAAIVLEEAGEVIREANRLDEGVGCLKALRMEIIQTAATCFRMLNEMSKDEPDIIGYFDSPQGKDDAKNFLIEEEMQLNEHGQCIVSTPDGTDINLNTLLQMYADIRLKEVKNG